MISRLRQLPQDAVALIDDDAGRSFTYAELLNAVDSIAPVLRTAPLPSMAFLWCENTVGSVAAYLAALSTGVPVCLCEPRSDPFERLIGVYQPSIAILSEAVELPEGFENFFRVPSLGIVVAFRAAPYAVNPHKDLALLLQTSGSTGSPKLVRLSQQNLLSNADAIIDYLQLGADERSIQSLPFHYAYGLSLLNSHLLCGAITVLSSHSFMRPEFWDCFRRYACTSFAGVPFMYEVLHRLRVSPASEPTLRYFTQAGGALKSSLVKHFAVEAADHGKRFYIMYGQTEATARISYVPPSRILEKPDSIGHPIPGGKLRLEPVDESASELIYEGPNVMLGYASAPADLAKGDELKGILRTGDLAQSDAEGYFFITGRLNRFAKIFGKRVSLQDVESIAASAASAPAGAVERDGKLVVFLESESSTFPAVQSALARALAVPPPAIVIRTIGFLPRTASGKVDYNALQHLVSNASTEQRQGAH